MALFDFLFKGSKSDKEKTPTAGKTTAAGAPAQKTTTAGATPTAAKSTAAQPVTPKPAGVVKPAGRAPITAPRPSTAPKPQPQAPARAAPVAGPQPEKAPVQEAMSGDLDSIVSALQQIEQLISEEEGTEKKAKRDRSMSPVTLRVADIAKFAAPLFAPNVSIPPEATTEIYIKDLFSQLSRGKVHTSLKQLAQDIPNEYLRPDVDQIEDKEISVPLPLIVSVLDPMELRKRTTSVAKEVVVDHIPTLFTPATPIPTAPAKPAAAAPKPTPAAPPQPAVALPKRPVPPAAPPPQPAPVAEVRAAPPITTPKEEKPVISQPVTAPAAAQKATPLAPPQPAPVAEAKTLTPAPTTAEIRKPGVPEAPMPAPGAAAPKVEAAQPPAAAPTPPAVTPTSQLAEPKPTLAAPIPKPAPEVPQAPAVPVQPTAAQPAPSAAPPAPVKPTVAPTAPTPLRLRKEPAMPTAAEQKPVAIPTSPPAQPPVAAEAKRAPAPPPAQAKPPTPTPAVRPTAAKPIPTPAVAEPASPPPIAPRPPPMPTPTVAKAAPVPPEVIKPEAPISPLAPPPMAAPGKITDMLLGLAKPAAAVPPTPPPPAAPKPAPAPTPVTPAAAQKEPVPSRRKEPTPTKTVAPTPPPKPAEVPLPPIVGTGRILPLMHRGIDLNTATAEEITSHLEGIGRAMAERIVEDRKQNGPFYALYDLARVSGIGARLFERITGWKWEEDIYGQLNVVNQVLDKWDGGLPDLNLVAQRFNALSGFDACVILHCDGHLLASSWDPQFSQAMEAMGPQIVKRVAQYIKNVCPEELLSVTIFLLDRVVILSQHEDIIFVGIRSPRALNRRHLQVIQGMAMALGKRFSGLRDAAIGESPSA